MTKLKMIILLLTCAMPVSSLAEARIKDIVNIEGVRDNLLIGYGLVVGLNGTGDNLTNAAFTQKGLVDFLERLGVNTRGANLKTKNIAAVTITASLPPFARQGNRIDIAVSTIGDAKSLQGGTLLATPLLGADGEVYAVAQGSLSLGGFSAATKAATTLSKSVATNGFIPNGAIIEKEIEFDFRALKTIKLSLRNPDISTAINIAHTVNSNMQREIADVMDPGTVGINVQEDQQHNVMQLLAKIETLPIRTDQPAKIVIDEGAGTIVMGKNVSVSPIAISQGNLSIVIKDPAQQATAADNIGKEMRTLGGESKLQELVAGLNALGVGPRDLVNILENIRVAGALQADIETR